MKGIIRASIILGWATLISLIVAVIKRKIWAVYLGPAGLGVYSQIFNYFNVVAIIATFGLSQGITTYIARNIDTDLKEARLDIIKTAMSILIFLSLVLVAISILFSRNISALITNDTSAYFLLILVAIGIPFQVLGQGFLSFLQGVKQVKKISLANISISILGLLCTIPLIIYFKILGAAISTLFLAIITFAIFIYAIKDIFPLKSLLKIFDFRSTLRSPFFIKLVNFGFLRFAQTGFFWLTFFAMRVFILKKLGASSNGIYEAAYTFSLLYLPFISSILWSYSYPDYCRAQNGRELSEAVNKFLRLSITIAFPLIVLLILARPILIEKILFTPQFNQAVRILPIRLIVDLLTIMVWSFNVVLMARERLKVAVGFELIRDVLLLGTIAFIISKHKLTGVLIADALTCLLLLSISYTYIKRHFNFQLFGKNLSLLISSLVLVVIISLFPVNNFIFIIAGLIIVFLWCMHFVSFDEIKQVFNSLRIASFVK